MRWTTATELGCASFAVERSTDGASWIDLAELPCGAPDGSYGVIDPPPPRGTVYYRLRQTDTDGGFAHTPIASVVTDLTATATPTVTPVGGEWHLSGFPADATLLLHDATGRIVREFSAGTTVLPPGSLPRGTYVLRCTSCRERQAFRLLR